ncbi:MltR family transcriptional regulator [Ursidibacter arcticus]
MLKQDPFIEQLSEIATVRGFLALSAQQIALQVEGLIQRVFRKTDFALKSVVDSLFEHQGPLAELSVRLKVLLGLGVITPELYQDINAILELKIQLSDEIEEPLFTSALVISLIQKLHSTDLALITNVLKQKIQPENKDSMLFQMQQLRLEKVIRSSLTLSINHILESLSIESPL